MLSGVNSGRTKKALQVIVFDADCLSARTITGGRVRATPLFVRKRRVKASLAVALASPI